MHQNRLLRFLTLLTVATLLALPALPTLAAPDADPATSWWSEARERIQQWVAAIADTSDAPPTALPDIDPDGPSLSTTSEDHTEGSGEGDALPNIDPNG